MPWKERTPMSERTAFCLAARSGEGSLTALCASYGISRKTGYKWLKRFREEGAAGLVERSRRPHTSPRQTTAVMEEAVQAVRAEHPTWGGRKIAWVLERQGLSEVPSPSTITAILRRHGQLSPESSAKHRPFQRFVKERPNELWQMDFKGHFVLADCHHCHPLSVLDDHSRFLVGLQACGDEKRETVQAALTALFRTYGLPERILADNGSPWGFGPSQMLDSERERYTRLTVWLLRLGVAVSHGRIRHPQTQGKDERLHRTLNEELLQQRALIDLASCQCAFDRWRHQYNHERPHEALGMELPAAYYCPSPRPFPETLPTIMYDEGTCVRIIDAAGRLYFHNRRWRIGKAFRGEAVAVEPDSTDGTFIIRFGSHPVYRIDLNATCTMDLNV